MGELRVTKVAIMALVGVPDRDLFRDRSFDLFPQARQLPGLILFTGVGTSIHNVDKNFFEFLFYFCIQGRNGTLRNSLTRLRTVPSPKSLEIW